MSFVLPVDKSFPNNIIIKNLPCLTSAKVDGIEKKCVLITLKFFTAETPQNYLVQAPRLANSKA